MSRAVAFCMRDDDDGRDAASLALLVGSRHGMNPQIMRQPTRVYLTKAPPGWELLVWVDTPEQAEELSRRVTEVREGV